MRSGLRIEYCGEWTDVAPGEILTIGREGDLVVDDNPALDGHLLAVSHDRAVWWIANAGTQRTVRVSDPTGRVATDLLPGGRVPLVFTPAIAVFSAGPTTYEVGFHGELPFSASERADEGSLGLDLPRLTLNQRLLLVVLCERALRRPHSGPSDFPTSAEAAARLGWSLTAFNRKLDNVCDRLDRAGVPGLRGGRGNLATRRRIRLVEFALASRLVTADDLALLSAPARALG